MLALSLSSIRRPWRTIVVALALTLVAAPGVTRLRIRTDGHALVPTDDTRIDVDRAIRTQFGVHDPILILIRTTHESGVYNLATLGLIKTLSAELQALPGVDASLVSSLATDRGHRVFPGTLTPRPFLEPMPETAADLARLRDDVRAIGLYTGVIVSDDERAAAILVPMPHGVDRIEFLDEVGGLVERHRLETGAPRVGDRLETGATRDGHGEAQGGAVDRIDVIGAPVAESLLGTHILEDLGVPRWALGHDAAGLVGDRSGAAGRAARATGGVAGGLIEKVRGLIARTIGLVPLAMAVMVLVFLACFRSLSAALLPLVQVGGCLAFVFGLMGWFDVPIYLTIAVMPVILTAVGVADEIHVFHRYFEELRAHPDRGGSRGQRVEALEATLREMHGPVVKTSITTAIGFCSFALSPIAAVQAFGIFTAVGVLYCMICSLAAIPAMLVVLPRRWARPKPALAAVSAAQSDDPVRADPSSGRTSFLGRLGLLAARGRWVVVGMTVAGAAMLPLGVRQVVVQDSWIDGFSPSSAFHRATTYFNEHFLGAHILVICVEAPDFELSGVTAAVNVGHHEVRIPAPAGFSPAQLRHAVLELSVAPFAKADEADEAGRRTAIWDNWIEDVEAQGETWAVRFLRPLGSPVWALRTDEAADVYYRISPRPFAQPGVLEELAAFEHYLAKQEEHAVGGVHGPATYMATTHFITGALDEDRRRIPKRIQKVRDEWANHARVRGPGWHRRTVDERYTRGLINVYMKDANFIETGRLIEKIRAYERKHLAPHGMSVSLAGDVAVSQTLISGIVRTQVRSLIGSLVGILIAAMLLGRSIRWGLFCVIPVSGAVLVNFAAMGWLGVPLGVATSMFSGMTLGIGVDYAIHVLERYRQSRANRWPGRPRPVGCPETEDNRAAIVDAVRASGHANLIDGLGVALGFGVIILSQVPANARLGGLIVLSIGTCLLLTLVLLPALLSIWPIQRVAADQRR